MKAAGAIGDVLRFAGLTAVTHYFVDGDPALFALCMGAGVAASIVQAVWTTDPDRVSQMPFHVPVGWASAAAVTYSMMINGLNIYTCTCEGIKR